MRVSCSVFLFFQICDNACEIARAVSCKCGTLCPRRRLLSVFINMIKYPTSFLNWITGYTNLMAYDLTINIVEHEKF